MNADEVPQEGNATLGGHRKAVYARAAGGRITAVASRGWEVEEIVTAQAAEALHRRAEAARAAALAGTGSPLAYWMYARRMDATLLAQASERWRWLVERDLKRPVQALPERVLHRYAQALALSPHELSRCPPTPEAAP